MSYIWINQPGDYSGDTWHIAAALEASQDCAVVQTVLAKDEKRARRARKFYADIGIDSSRIREIALLKDPTEGLHLSQPGDRIEYNRRNRRCAEHELAHDIQYPILYVYQATSIAITEIRDKNVRNAIAERLCKGFETDYPQASKCLEQLAARVPAGAVLIVGRYADYYPTANASDAIIGDVLKCARQSARPCLLFADRSNASALSHAERYDLRVVDVYNTHPSYRNIADTGLDDLRAAAYFWRSLSKLEKDIVVVGGRSGSTDSAAYMGLAVVEWDCFDVRDPEALRLSKMAPFLCSTLYADTCRALQASYYYNRWNDPVAPPKQCYVDAITVLKDVFCDPSIHYGAKHEANLADYVEFSSIPRRL